MLNASLRWRCAESGVTVIVSLIADRRMSRAKDMRAIVLRHRARAHNRGYGVKYVRLLHSGSISYV